MLDTLFVRLSQRRGLHVPIECLVCLVERQVELVFVVLTGVDLMKDGVKEAHLVVDVVLLQPRLVVDKIGHV